MGQVGHQVLVRLRWRLITWSGDGVPLITWDISGISGSISSWGEGRLLRVLLLLAKDAIQARVTSWAGAVNEALQVECPVVTNGHYTI